ncbi:MAG: alpha-glucosidase [Lachnospiraceae bacterium]|nr:alpha-glucosidase [Lachnospiraceae bacterium]
MEKDFRRCSFYQIWIRSFKDGNGDGIGDLAGVLEKLPYIKSLGVDGIWFSPIYPSPNADYGYDISDYRNIHPDYGTLDDFKKVLDKAHELGLWVIMDLVINHTSDEHPWFVESCKSKDNPYSDYYIWRDPKWVKGKMLPPNNWFSQFEGLAWEYCESRQQYYLHVFARKQPDLNMDNPKVREEVKSIMRFWLDMGVDGFREDVITYISKQEGLPDGLSFLPAINGLPFYKDGPHIMEYLREFREVAKEYGAVQIGEAPMTPVKTALSYMSGEDRVLDMMIQFDTMMADCFLTEYVYHKFTLRKLKRAFSKWQTELDGKAWNALYLENHDHPRVINRYGSLKYWRESGKMLAACYIFQQGTPFIYQGQEIGMTNIRLESIDQYLDVASKNAYHSFHLREKVEKRLRRIHVSSRDSARTPVQWNREKNAGFTTGEPWFYVNRDYKRINVEAEEQDPGSILNFYRKCLALRKSSETLIWGKYREYFPLSSRIYMYERSYEGERILVICSFSKNEERFRFPKGYDGPGELLLDNYDGAGQEKMLRPYEVRVLRYEVSGDGS